MKQLLSVLLILTYNSTSAITFNINTTEDQIDTNVGDGMCQTMTNQCSLRAAIMESNSTGVSNILILPDGTYQISLTGREEDEGLTGDFDISKDLQILGESLENTIIDANFNDRIFDLIPDSQITVSLSNLTIINGETVPPNNASKGLPDGWAGGAIKVNELSHLQLDTLLFNNHHAFQGGIIFTKGKVVGNKVQLNNSSSGFGGGAVYIAQKMAQVLLTQCLFEGNQSDSNGAAIASFPFEFVSDSRLSLELNQCAFINNTSTTNRGIIFNIHVSQTIIRNSTFSGNNANDAILFNDESSTIDIYNSSFINNNAPFLFDAHASPLFVSFSNSVMANNQPTSCHSSFTSRGGNVFADVTDVDFCNAVFDESDTFTVVKLLLSPLIKYQQPWQQIHLPLSGSILLDNGRDETCETQDQLGFQRQQDNNFDGMGHCNIGATAISDVVFISSF